MGNFSHGVVIAAVLIGGMVTPTSAQDAAALCPNDPLAQQLIEWNRQHGQRYDDIIRQCQASQRAAQPKPVDPASTALVQQIQRNVEVATRQMKENPELGRQCLDAYKDGMDDPSSFQWRDRLVLDETASYMASQMAYRKEHKGRLVAFQTAVRGKNRFGALVKATISCWYLVDGESVSFDRVTEPLAR